MFPISKRIGLCIITAILGILIAGCAPSDNSVDQDSKNVIVPSPTTPSQEQTVKKPAKKDLTISSPDRTTDFTDAESNKSDKESDQAAITEVNNTNPEKATVDNYNVTEPYNSLKPTLMGFTVNDSADAVVTRFGKPISESVMNDGLDPLQIYEYPGFIVGVNKAKLIVFIEVTTEQVNPGLNQLRIGQTAQDALKALGTPQSSNEYVMVYESGGLVLKFDLDPNNGIIRSIKLFAN